MFVCVWQQSDWFFLKFPPIRLVPPRDMFLLGCTYGRTACVYDTRIQRAQYGKVYEAYYDIHEVLLYVE